MSGNNRRDGLPPMKGDGRFLEQNLDSPPPSYETAMTESYGRPYAPLPTGSPDHRDNPVARTHPTSPPYPTSDTPLPSNPPYCTLSDPRNESSRPIAPYPTNESVYIPSHPTSSTAFYNPMNQMPSPSGPGISQPTGETSRSAANPQIGFKVTERYETTTVSPQFPDVNRGSGDCQYMKFFIAVIGLAVIIGVGIYVWRWSVERRRLRMKAREERMNNEYFFDSSYFASGQYSDRLIRSDDWLHYTKHTPEEYYGRSLVSREKRRVERREDRKRRESDDNDVSEKNWSRGKIQKNISRILSVAT